MTDTVSPTIRSPEMSVGNYCVCFLDILGQRSALRDQGLLPPEAATPEGRTRFIQEVMTKTILPITRLQGQTNEFMKTFLKRAHSPTRESLPEELRNDWDKLQEQQLHVQYWSDGLVAFSSLANKEMPTQLNAAFALLGMAGSLCFMNLGNQFRNPIRGGIEIAWGTELRPGELYGPAIARAYELESKVAKYPRIIVGARMTEFLEAHAKLPPTDVASRYSATLATMCLHMLFRDIDGQWAIHYLGDRFREAVSRGQHVEMYVDAQQFVVQEYERFRIASNSELATRYFHLRNYFQSFIPKELAQRPSS